MPDQCCGDPKLPPSTSGGVTSVAASSPLSSSGGDTPTISLASAVPINKGGTGAATAPANRVFAGPPSGADAAPSYRAIVSADLAAISLLTAATLFVSPVSLGTGVGWSQIAGGYSWGTSWIALRDTTLINVRAYCADTSGTLHLNLWVGGVAVASGTVAVTAAGVYTLATPFSHVVTAGTTFTVSAYCTAEVQGIPYIANNYTNTSYPFVASPTLLLANPRLYSGAGNAEPTSTSSNYIFGVEPVIGG